MKMTLTIFTLLFCITFNSTHAQLSWEIIPTGVSSNFTDMDVYGTEDLFFIDDDYDFTHSSNAGSTFTTINESAMYWPIEAVTDSVVYLASGSGDIYKTENRGNTWELQFTGCGCLVSQIAFTDLNHGIATGTSGVYQTINGGLTWTLDETLDFWGAFDIQTFSDGYIMLVDEFDFYISKNHGTTFQQYTFDALDSYYMVAVSFIDHKNGFVISADGQLYKTTNEGDSWTFVSKFDNEPVEMMEFVDAYNGFIVTGDFKDKIYFTHDGGNTWELSFTSPELLRSMVQSPTYVYAAGLAGTLLRLDVNYLEVPDQVVKSTAVYPNPANDEISIVTDLANVTFKIVNAIGENVMQFNTTNQATSIDISKLTPGLYYIVNADNMLDAQPFVKL